MMPPKDIMPGLIIVAVLIGLACFALGAILVSLVWWIA